MPGKNQSIPSFGQDETYQEASEAYGAALGRLARAYEAEPEKRADLLQEIHIALWKSLRRFNGNCSLRTWAFRIAHNVAASHVLRERRRNRVRQVGLEELDDLLGSPDGLQSIAEHQALERLTELIRQLLPIDRQVILSYLEGMDADAISELTGLSAPNVSTKVHRIKDVRRRPSEPSFEYEQNPALPSVRRGTGFVALHRIFRRNAGLEVFNSRHADRH